MSHNVRNLAASPERPEYILQYRPYRGDVTTEAEKYRKRGEYWAHRPEAGKLPKENPPKKTRQHIMLMAHMMRGLSSTLPIIDTLHLRVAKCSLSGLPTVSEGGKVTMYYNP